VSIDGWVTGLSNHAKERLADRFGIRSLEEQKAFAALVCGVEGRDWIRSTSSQVDPTRGEGAHGRLVRWNEEEILCVVVFSLHGFPMVTTVLDNLFVTEDQARGPTYQDLMEEVERMSKTLASVQESYNGKVDECVFWREQYIKSDNAYQAIRIELNLEKAEVLRLAPVVHAFETIRTFFKGSI